MLVRHFKTVPGLVVLYNFPNHTEATRFPIATALERLKSMIRRPERSLCNLAPAPLERATMLIENCPIISVNVRVWLFWGYLRRVKWHSYLVGCIPVTVLNVFQFMNLFHIILAGTGDINKIIIDGYFTVLYFNLVLRTSFLMTNRHKFERFFDGIASEYRRLENQNDIRPLLERLTRRARILSKSNLWLGAFISACFVTYPLFSPENVLPYGVYMPGIDLYASPVYEIVFVLQIYLTFPACCMYIPFTSFYCTCSLFGLVRIAALKRSLERLHEHNRSEQTLLAKMKECLVYHKEIIRYVADLNELVTYIFLLELLSFGMMLCALLFLLSISNQLAQMVMIGSYIFMILSQMYALYWHSNEVREQSLEIGDSLYYNSAWLGFSMPVKKMIILLVARAQRPLAITIGNVYPMTLEMFQSLLNASYSYFTLLRRVYN
ncbi:odorant receptor Or2-like isoform X2 [Wyeomyia smithii]|uniref:odorant receptor Or2-like isoform X2 n=1 Tax=Wyeomyia smithii TaxID=174621 RepID=UPI0024681048|nr:odorant receptor Or2-like isoform X2 [Wyeomyia smithii]